MQWFRMYSEFASDPKIQMMTEAMQRRFVMLLCLRCNVTVTLHDEEIAFQLRISQSEWQETKALFVEKKFINKDNEVLNWDKRQYVSDTSKERVSRFRERKRNASVTPCNVTVTVPDTDTDTDTDTESKSIIYTAFESYNLIAKDKGLPVAQKLTSSRKSKLQARIKQNGLDGWSSCLAKVSSSKFLTGDNNNGWKADFDFIINESNFQKIIEGKYDSNGKKTRAEQYDAAVESALRKLEERDRYEEGLLEEADFLLPPPMH